MKSEKVTLISSDGVNFEVDKAVAIQSGTIKRMIDEDGAGNVFSLHKAASKILDRTLFFMENYSRFEREKRLICHGIDDLLGRKTRYLAAVATAAAAVDDADRDLGEVQIKRLAAEEKQNHWNAMFVMVDQNTLFDLIRISFSIKIYIFLGRRLLGHSGAAGPHQKGSF
ncbi:hypothetical protein Pint_28487 [Pistacia integerrima]|uniref:Uncharacterized protein n=1 Tax=Pistacia integerrima TaxID=434235 RepID=A0ACC0YSR0_9ROSI|nr:hypothetical protein Pint_28487 [Pistacia integerrima]